VKPFSGDLGIDAAMIEQGPPLELVIGLLKDRAATVKEIADNAAMFYQEPVIDPGCARAACHRKPCALRSLTCGRH